MKPSEKKNLIFANAIAQKQLGELDESVGYSANMFMLFGLPTQKLPAEQKQWVKENNNYTFTLTQVHKDFEIPYGCYARMNQIFIDTEIKTKITNIIDLGNSFNEYIKKIGYHEGFAYRGVQRQLSNLIRCAISMTCKIPGADVGFQTLIGRKWFITLDERSPDQPELFKSRILIDRAYADYVYERAVPLDLEVVRFFNRNPLALDFYRFLAYRNNNLKKPVVLPDAELFDQLGNLIEDTKIIRFRLTNILKKIQAYWPINARFKDGAFHLFPSPPAVKQKPRIGKPLLIVNNLGDK